MRFAVHGTGGSIIKPGADQQEAQLIAGLRPGNDGWGHDPDPLQHWDANGVRGRLPAQTGAQQCYYAQIAACLADDAEPPITPAAILAVQEVLDAARLSARTGQTIALPLPPA